MSSSSTQNATGANPFAQIMQIATGYMPAACLYTAAKLKIADLVSGGPKPVAELAQASGMNEDGLYRVLRALASIGVFQETTERTFGNSAVSERLRSDLGVSDRDTVLFVANPHHLKIFGELLHSVETGGTAIKKVTGLEAFEYFRENPEEGQLFNSAMTSISAGLVRPVIQTYDFGESGTSRTWAADTASCSRPSSQKHRGLQGISTICRIWSRAAENAGSDRGVDSRCQIVREIFSRAVPQAEST